MADPLVSTVIPAHQAERYLREAIESVLAQAHRPLEVVVVDDGSTDGTRALAESFGDAVRYVFQEPAGAAAARNRGVALASGDYLAFLDADDRWEPAKLDVQLRAMSGAERPDLVFGHARQFLSPDVADALRANVRVPPGLQPSLLIGTLLARRGAFERVGALNTSLRAGEFMEWLMRARELGLRELMVDDHVLSRRIHAANMMRRDPGSRRDYALVIKAALDRRRKLGLAQ